MLNDVSVTSILKPLHMVNSCPVFDHAAKQGKASRDAYNPGLLLILKNWVAKVSLLMLLNEFSPYVRWSPKYHFLSKLRVTNKAV